MEFYFKGFFNYLEKTSTFITYIYIFRTIYRSGSPLVFSKNGVLLQICTIFTEEYPFRNVISIKLKSHFCMGVFL